MAYSRDSHLPIYAFGDSFFFFFFFYYFCFFVFCFCFCFFFNKKPIVRPNFKVFLNMFFFSTMWDADNPIKHTLAPSHPGY